MTTKERAQEIAKELVRAYEIGATMKDLDGIIHMWRGIVEKFVNDALEEQREALANQTARADAYARTCKQILKVGLRYRNALKLYGNPENWRFTHDKKGNLLWVCSMGPDYALEVLDDDELNAVKPHIGLRGIEELKEAR
jgi:hypothetical protein